MSYRIFNLKDRPDLIEPVLELGLKLWPEFIVNEPVSKLYWGLLFTEFSQFQIALLDDKDELAAAGHSIPLKWSGQIDDLPSGFGGVIEQGVSDYKNKVKPNTLSALSAVVVAAHRGKLLSRKILKGFKSCAIEQGFDYSIAPVRPVIKCRYPITAMEKYIAWQRADGSPFDPWIRTHWQAGAKILKIAPRSMVISGSVADWEKWTGMKFPESGRYVVPNALQPIIIDREKDSGIYEDPNVWMQRPLD